MCRFSVRTRIAFAKSNNHQMCVVFLTDCAVIVEQQHLQAWLQPDVCSVLGSGRVDYVFDYSDFALFSQCRCAAPSRTKILPSSKTTSPG